MGEKPSRHMTAAGPSKVNIWRGQTLSSVFALLAGNFKSLSNEGTVTDFFRTIDKDTYWESHREEVKDAFVTSWDAYFKYAWGTWKGLASVRSVANLADMMN